MGRCISTLNRVRASVQNIADGIGGNSRLSVYRRLILEQACNEIEAVVKDLEKGETYGNPE